MSGAALKLPTEGPQFFISRTSADAAIAIAVADALIAQGYRVLIQDKDFANQNFMHMMDAGLASGARVIAILSEDYFRSEHCFAEWSHPLADDPLNKQTRLIVLKARECVPRGLLKAIAYWDLVKVRGTPELLKATVLAAVDPAHRAAPQIAELWRKPDIIRHSQIRATPGFTGRGDELAAIEGALRARETPALTQSTAVQGLGGVGKSTIAREYAWRVSQYDCVYAGVWWFDAAIQGQGSWPGIEQSYIELGDRFIRGLAQRQDRSAAARDARTFIEDAGFAQPWLFVYDNVDDVRTLADWPPPKGAHVIITSRLESKTKGVTAVEIGTWPLPDAIHYLRDASARPDLTEAQAQEIAEALGCLPLAIAHAAAYLSDTANATAESYLKSVIAHMRKVPEGALVIAPRAVFATLQHNIAQAEARAPGAAAVMSLAAHYAPDGIPMELFQQSADLYPPAFAPLCGDGPALEEAIGALGRLKVIAIDRDAKTFSVHRLVQAAARDALQADGGVWADAAVRAVDAVFPIGQFGISLIGSRLYEHARAAITAGRTVSSLSIAKLSAKIAIYLHLRGYNAPAEQLMKSVHNILEQELGPDDADVGTTLNNIGLIYHDQGKNDLAESAYNRALAIGQKAFGADHPEVGMIHNNLSALYHAQEKYDLAWSHCEHALAIIETARGPYDPYFGMMLNNIGSLCEALGKYDVAETQYKRALVIRENALGLDHQDVGQTLNNLAGLYSAQGKYDLAEPLYQRAIAICKKAPMANRGNLALTLQNLAVMHAISERSDEALMLARRAVSIFEHALELTHPLTVTAVTNLAAIERAIAKRDG